MKPLHLARVKLFYNFVDNLRRAGHPIERSLNKFNLPPTLDDTSNFYVPLLPASRVVTFASNTDGITDIGYRVVRRMNVRHLSANLQAAVHHASTLKTGLLAFRKLARLENNLLTVQLTRQDSVVEVRSTIAGTKGLPHLEHSQWVQNMMAIYIVREFAGPNWMPSTFAFEARYTPSVETQAEFPNTRFLSGQDASWIDVPVSVLSLPKWRTSRSDTSCDVIYPPPEDDLLSIHSDIVTQLKLVLPAYLVGSTPNIAMLAEIAGTSPRTLQRRLNSIGMSYSDLLDQVRFETSVQLLRNTDAKIIDVAFATGYADPAHFTRAFRRIAGTTPREYRLQHRAA